MENKTICVDANAWRRGERGVLSHYIYIYKRERGEGIGERARRKEIESS